MTLRSQPETPGTQTWMCLGLRSIRESLALNGLTVGTNLLTPRHFVGENKLLSQQPSTTVYATSRSSSTPSDSSKPNNVHWVTKIDLMSPSCGTKLASSLKSTRIDTLYITAGYFATEDFSKGH